MVVSSLVSTHREGEDVVLLVDDDPSNLALLERALRGRGYRLVSCQAGAEALELARRERPTLVLLDVVMPAMDGYEVCSRLKADEQTRDCAVVFLSALDEADHKVRGLELGAVDYLAKPFDREEVITRVQTHVTVQRLQRQLQRRTRELERELRVAQQLVADQRDRHEGPLLGGSAPARALRESVAAAAESEEPVLLLSPAGAGEEAAARAIHHQSPRGERPFLRVDCLSVEAADTPLFASEGASKWGLARGGTIYLDRVEVLAESLQQELARRLVEAPASDDPRVIATVLGDRGEGAAGRLEAIAWRTIRVPSLAERREDIPELAQHFLSRAAQRQGRQIEGISPESLRRLVSCPWRGNVEELRSVLDCALITSRGALVEVNEALLETGRRVGSYELVEPLGAGRHVWEARHRLLIRPAAIKFVRSARLADPSTRLETVRQFEEEARATASLRSPNTVQLYDFGVTEEGALYYAMELLRGMDLEALVARHGAVPPARAVGFVQQACGSLAEAHERGLIHRDVRPANLFVCCVGPTPDVVKVLDFGLTRELAQSACGSATCAKGALVCSPAFAAPEALQGAPCPESDVYSLGCTLYWLLSGVTVFSGDPAAHVSGHLGDAPGPPSRLAAGPLPAGLDELVLDCLSKDPLARPSAREVRRRLRALSFAQPWTEDAARAWWRERAE